MSIGALLVGAGTLAVVIAYVARPFRASGIESNLDRAIEAWVAQVQDHGIPDEESAVSKDLDGISGARPSSEVNFCPQCGRQVAPDDRFCSGCGKQLRGGSA